MITIQSLFHRVSSIITINNCLHVVIAIRDDPEYHVAMEMEVWRAEQEELFMKQV